VADPVTVYVTDYGRHASLVLPTGPDALVEYSYGDWTFYALKRDTLPNGLAALFCSKQGALGARPLVDPHDPRRLAAALNATVQGLEVERSAANDLAARLRARYVKHVDTEIYNAAYKTYFVKDPEPYGLSNNSNLMTARWLRDLGCEVRGPGLLSNFVVERPKAPPKTSNLTTTTTTTPTHTPCQSEAR
jgi:hypothetical protein